MHVTLVVPHASAFFPIGVDQATGLVLLPACGENPPYATSSYVREDGGLEGRLSRGNRFRWTVLTKVFLRSDCCGY